MQVTDSILSGVKFIQPRVFRDARGFFVESFSEPRYAQAGIDVRFVQDNHSRSVRGTLRGLHFQSSPGQAKLVRVATGCIWDVVVDIRPSSPTFGKWEGVELDADKHAQLFMPIGFAHGFCVLSETADVLYKVSNLYDSTTEFSIRYDDPELAVAWPVKHPIVSDRDLKAESFAAYRARVMP
jgi:dTDP-4-dehydrorhamnose 3,5-epimerase